MREIDYFPALIILNSNYVRGRGRGERGEGVKCVECGEVQRKERGGD